MPFSCALSCICSRVIRICSIVDPTLTATVASVSSRAGTTSAGA